MNIETENNEVMPRQRKFIVTDLVARRIQLLEFELRDLRESLEYYAVRENWDFGFKARKILAKWGQK